MLKFQISIIVDTREFCSQQEERELNKCFIAETEEQHHRYV